MVVVAISASGERGHGPEALEGGEELVFPWPPGGHLECHCAGGAGDPAGNAQQSATEGPGGRDDCVGQPDQGRPAQQVVRERRDHGPGGVCDEVAGREMRQCLVFEVTDREFHNGVLAVLCFHLLDRVGAVGQERVMAPVGPQLGLGADQAGAAYDQPVSRASV